MRLLLLLFPVLLLSCKKDKLDGDYQVLEGTWRLSAAVKIKYYANSQFTIRDTIEQFANVYELDFKKRGKVRYLRDGEELNEYRIVFAGFTEQDTCYSEYFTMPSPYYETDILLNNKEENFLRMCYNQSEMQIYNREFPFPDGNDGAASVTYLCYYKKL